MDKDGVRTDPGKTEAIQQMKPPENVSELRRFMGMVNQLGQFSPHIAEISQPLRELLSTKRAWTWGPDQDRALNQIKTELSRPTVLSLYNPRSKTKVSADASSHGLGAVLLQEVKGTWRPVAYASRAMSDTEKRYAQIEKEALASTWACEKFADYLLGLHFLIESDHKPLIPLLGNKCLESLPPRVLRFRLKVRLQHHTCTRQALVYSRHTLKSTTPNIRTYLTFTLQFSRRSGSLHRGNRLNSPSIRVSTGSLPNCSANRPHLQTS